MKEEYFIKDKNISKQNQRVMINNNIGCARYMYNHLLAMYNDTKKVVSYKEIYHMEELKILAEQAITI